mmetsp:Transcript_4050/g.8359  ORF Transcript_4050/g.8359 Transcript_4050/m.8359 type:complete len:81 (-) Transcript_4050:1510-1752(-)
MRSFLHSYVERVAMPAICIWVCSRTVREVTRKKPVQLNQLTNTIYEGVQKFGPLPNFDLLSSNSDRLPKMAIVLVEIPKN